MAPTVTGGTTSGCMDGEKGCRVAVHQRRQAHPRTDAPKRTNAHQPHRHRQQQKLPYAGLLPGAASRALRRGAEDAQHAVVTYGATPRWRTPSRISSTRRDGGNRCFLDGGRGRSSRRPVEQTSVRMLSEPLCREQQYPFDSYTTVLQCPLRRVTAVLGVHNLQPPRVPPTESAWQPRCTSDSVRKNNRCKSEDLYQHVERSVAGVHAHRLIRSPI